MHSPLGIVDYSAEKISTDGSLVLLEKIEKEHKLIKYYSKYIPDHKDQSRIDHSTYHQLKQRILC